jgi:predicted LPLAT superfamily acyltransferase
MRKEPRDKEDRTRWTSRSVGSNLQHNIFYFLIRYGGRGASYALLHCVAVYYALFRPAIRKKRTTISREGLRPVTLSLNCCTVIVSMRTSERH